MNPNDATTTSTSEIKHRLIIPIQTRGGLGKSTTAIGLCEWLQRYKVSWQGYDLDGFNRTLSKVFPRQVAAIELSREPEGDLMKIFRNVSKTAVTLIDPSAHLNRIILSAFEKIDFPHLAAQEGTRISVLIYPYDEISDMDDISQTFATLGNRVDWIIVRNQAQIPTTRFFTGSELEAKLVRSKAAVLHLPILLSDTRSHLRAHEVQLGRGISPGEAIENLDLPLDLIHRTILAHWQAELFRGFDAIAAHLVPEMVAKLIQPTEVATKAPAKKDAAINLENIL